MTLSLQLKNRPTLSEWSNLFALTPIGFLRKDWACLRSRRRNIYLAWSDHFVDLETCPQMEVNVNKWWREWFAQQKQAMTLLQQTQPESGWQAVHTSYRADAHYHWAYDEVVFCL